MTTKSAATRVLSDPASLALPLSVALDSLTQGRHVAWSLETTLLYLAGEKALPDEDSRDKILSVIAIRNNPAYLWDANVFKNVAMVFNDRECLPDQMDACSPAELSWAVVEIERIHARYSGGTFPGYGDEPCTYMAGVCANAGLSVLPEQLEFVEPYMELFPNLGSSYGFEEAVKNRLTQDKAEEVDDSDAVEVHASKLFEIETYVWHRTLELDKQLSLLDAIGR